MPSSTIVPVSPSPDRLSPAPRERDSLINIREVCKRTGLSRPTIQRLIIAGKFPKRVKVGTATRWSERAVSQWIDDQVAGGR